MKGIAVSKQDNQHINTGFTSFENRSTSLIVLTNRSCLSKDPRLVYGNSYLPSEAMKNKLPNHEKTAPNEKGEAMKDSMTESTINNDNEKLPAAEEFTDENGELDAEAFKKSYQEDAKIIKDDQRRN